MLLLAQAAGLGLLPMLVGMLLSEVVDIDEFGRFYAGLGMAMTAVYLGGLGLDKIILKVIAAARKSGDSSDARGLRHAGPPLDGPVDGLGADVLVRGRLARARS